MGRGLRTATLAAVCGALLASPVAADDVPAPPVSGVSQYVEELPTAGGGTVVGTAKPQTRKLPPSVQKKVVQQGGQDAAALEQIATSSAYGAPQSQLQPAPGREAPVVSPAVKPPATPQLRQRPVQGDAMQPLESAASARLSESDSGGYGFAALALALITASAVLTFAARKMRVQRPLTRRG